jgi:programmed cell death protein 5
VSRIALVKPEKASALSDQLLSMAQRGAITEKISEQRLKQMLESTSEGNSSRTPKITVSTAEQPQLCTSAPSLL